MEQRPLAGLEPACVFRFFEEICAIPHGSRNTKTISDYLVRFAQERGLRFRQDEWNNVVIFQPGTPGYEDHSPVILQGHMDMVCEKEPDCPIDFEHDGLDLTHDGTDIFARGTTLGGDDGVAVAYALALLDSKEIPHPPLEVIITVDEEIGMLGAAAMDLSDLRGRTMVNLDSEDEGILTVSCAGGATAFIDLPLNRRPVYGPCVEILVDGLQGGHSGVEIHKNRANANQVMGELLVRIQEKMPVCIVSLAGGSKDNAIPRSCRVNLVAMGLELSVLQEMADTVAAETKCRCSDPDLAITLREVEALGGLAMSTDDSKKVAALLQAVPNGVQAMSSDIEGLVQTSLNLGIAQVEEDHLHLHLLRPQLCQRGEGGAASAAAGHRRGVRRQLQPDGRVPRLGVPEGFPSAGADGGGIPGDVRKRAPGGGHSCGPGVRPSGRQAARAGLRFLWSPDAGHSHQPGEAEYCLHSPDVAISSGNSQAFVRSN